MAKIHVFDEVAKLRLNLRLVVAELGELLDGLGRQADHSCILGVVVVLLGNQLKFIGDGDGVAAASEEVLVLYRGWRSRGSRDIVLANRFEHADILGDAVNGLHDVLRGVLEGGHFSELPDLVACLGERRHFRGLCAAACLGVNLSHGYVDKW